VVQSFSVKIASKVLPIRSGLLLIVLLLDYTIDPAQSLGNRISNIVDDEGTAIDVNKSYKVSGWAQVGIAMHNALARVASTQTLYQVLKNLPI
jgi:hypothetical protein